MPTYTVELTTDDETGTFDAADDDTALRIAAVTYRKALEQGAVVLTRADGTEVGTLTQTT